MTTLSARGRAALVFAALFSATAAPGCGLLDSCRDGCGFGTSKTETKSAADVVIPSAGGETILPAPAGDYQPAPQAGMTPAMR